MTSSRPPTDQPLYGITVAAELTGVNPQNLRVYEGRGLIEPHRTEGGTRRYSHQDVEQVHYITTLLATGLNLTGIAHVLELEAETQRLRSEIRRLRAQLEGSDSSESQPSEQPGDGL